MSNGLKDALKSFALVWLFGTLALFVPGLLGWINDVTAWARDEGTTPFPDAHGLMFFFVAALTAAFPAALAGVVRFLENYFNRPILPRTAGQPVPVKPPGEGGQAGWLIQLLGILLLVVLVVLLVRAL